MSWLSCFYWQGISAASDSRDSPALSSSPTPRTRLSPARIRGDSSRRSPLPERPAEDKTRGGQKQEVELSLQVSLHARALSFRFRENVADMCFMTGTGGSTPPNINLLPGINADALFVSSIFTGHMSHGNRILFWFVPKSRVRGTRKGPVGAQPDCVITSHKTSQRVLQGPLAKALNKWWTWFWKYVENFLIHNSSLLLLYCATMF